MGRFIAVVLVASACASLRADELPADHAVFKSKVEPFFKSHCIRCHGPEKNKGDITLHALGDLPGGRDVEQWELVLEMLEGGEMPPEDEPQPREVNRKTIVGWIEAGLRDYVARANRRPTAPTTRRLSNFEYQNTMRDLLGFELKLIENLPEDPVKPYQFNNTAEFMRIGPEQMDRYKENARRAMASAIVDPAKPEIHQTRREWEPRGGSPTEIQFDELGGRRGSPGGGMGIKSWPKTGEFKIRIQTAAIMPKGVTQVPLNLVMGSNINENSSTLLVEPLGTVAVTENVDNPQVFEFRGRIENFPPRARTAKGKVTYSMSVTPQNVYDDGLLNDHLNRLARPRLVVKWIEFEAPVFETWPPRHHTDILFGSPLRKSDPDAYVKAVLKRFMTRAFRRPVRDDEVETFAKIHKIVSMDLPTLEDAMRETLAMVLISPDFLYHTSTVAAVARRRGDNEEPHALASVGANPVITRQYELASRLAYFFMGFDAG